MHLLVLDGGRVQAPRTGLSRTQEGSRVMGFAQQSRPIPGAGDSALSWGKPGDSCTGARGFLDLAKS